LRWLTNVGRGVFVALVVFVALAIYGLGRLGTLFVLDRARRVRLVGRLRGRVMRRTMTVLGATFIKMGQVMSTRPDLFSREVIEELQVLQDRLPAFSFARARRIVEEDLGRPLAEIYPVFDPEPVAAASVAQVHRAELADGTEVAVKVLRPSIRRRVERDGTILLFGARLLNVSRKARLSDPVGHTRHFVDAIIDQTDLTLEADNYERFATNFAGDTRVLFPRVYRELSGKRVLTMQFIRGTKIDALGPGDHKHLAVALRQAMFQMCFKDGFIHADLHPGNIHVTAEGRLTLFDAGMAKQLGGEVLDIFIDMTKCLTMGSPDDVIAHMKRFHRYVGEVDWDRLRVDVEALAGKFRAREMAKLEYGELLGDMFALGRTYHIRPVTDLTLVFVALITSQGIGKMLNPNSNVFTEVATYLVPILMTRGLGVPETVEADEARARAKA
jgi:ubiquinone biosynthesis protein